MKRMYQVNSDFTNQLSGFITLKMSCIIGGIQLSHPIKLGLYILYEKDEKTATLSSNSDLTKK